MKAIVLPLVFGLLLFAAITATLRFTHPRKPLQVLVVLFLVALVALVATYLLSPADLGLFGPRWVAPSTCIELGVAVFLFCAGFFGGLLQLYNLADRGLSLRMLIDILEAPRTALTADEIVAIYGGGRGIAWMYGKRLADMADVGLTYPVGDRLALTARGLKIARLFAYLQQLARIEPPRLSQ